MRRRGRGPCDALVTIRDELRLKAHLAKSDIKDELNRLETKWQRVEEELKRTSGHVKQPLAELGHDTKELVHELKKGYDSVIKRLS
jgi:uncharacterized protein YicC (UPF0701 family)